MTTPNAHPTGPTPIVDPRPAPPLGHRVGAALRLLAELAEKHPALAVLIAATVEQLYVLSPRGTNPGLLVDALIERGAVRTAVEEEPWWDTEGFLLPGGAIRLLVQRLHIDDAPCADSGCTAAG